MHTERVLKRACQSPSDSELASLFILINRIKRDETLTNGNNGIVYRAMMERLKSCWVKNSFSNLYNPRQMMKGHAVCNNSRYLFLAMEIHGHSFAVL